MVGTKKKSDFGYVGWYWGVDAEGKVWIRENIEGGNTVQGRCLGRLEGVSYREKQRVPATDKVGAHVVCCVWIAVEGKKDQICLSEKRAVKATNQIGSKRIPCHPVLDSWIGKKHRSKPHSLGANMAGHSIYLVNCCVINSLSSLTSLFSPPSVLICMHHGAFIG